ncbi:hypothetical protein MPH_06633 [Macrophomina phaseolina MS6]|uniref:Uncharacterized protein n=1 Tax=Macrophomina phaseolina (strain MS6) TaxID=1126212 RepID=K2R1U7_MACPH|nr:hypothetical protein MPH_06633 [Macrophomina phaseolina MS6]
MHFQIGQIPSLLGTEWVTGKENVPRDMMDVARPTMTTAVLNVLAMCQGIFPIAPEMAPQAVGLAAGVQVPHTWIATDASLSGRGLGKHGRMKEEDLYREMVVRVVGLLHNGMNHLRALVRSIRRVMVRVAVLPLISKASLEMDAAGSLARCRHLLPVLINTLIAPAVSMSVSARVNYLTGPLRLVIEPALIQSVRP